MVRRKATTSLSRVRCYTSLLGRVSVSTVSVCLISIQNPRSPLIEVAAVLPLLAAKQRKTHKHDWISSDGLVACPDPNCKSVLKITRTGLRTFNHADTTVVGLEGNV